MDVKSILDKMTFEEKATLITGSANMSTAGIERLGIEEKAFADGPHGIRNESHDGNCTCMPCLTSLAASWDTDMAELYGETLANDCIEHGIDMILGPGVNIKKNMLCGRNFEYMSEDPVLAGEICAGYVNGLQRNGVAASVKHFAANNQERYRTESSSEIDERTLREIYLKAFEIAVKKSNPQSIMCAYNKVNSIWCSENKMLLTNILKEEWDYEGFVVSDWGAVHDIKRAVAAGLDLEMPKNDNIVSQLKDGLDKGTVTMEQIDNAAERILRFALKPKADKKPISRQKRHENAKKIAEAGIVLMKNDGDVLPLNKYKKIAVVGEFAEKPLFCGQGSAEVYPDEEYISSPLEELKKALPDTEITYQQWYKKREFPEVMQWPLMGEFREFIKDSDVVVLFAGSMESEDTEKFDRRTAKLSTHYELFIEECANVGKKAVVVLQSGGVIIPAPWCDGADAIVEMWLGGEASGEAVADVLSGKVNPSGRLPETFPVSERDDIDVGDAMKVEYKEKLDVGYRYYDKYKEKVVFPFGHGLSYTKFEYTDCTAEINGDNLLVSLTVKNIGNADGAEVVQIYTNDPVSTVTKPEKELKAFKKVFVKSGESERAEITIPMSELSYYNIMLRKWVTEPGAYNVLIGASSLDIRAKICVNYNAEPEYTMERTGVDMIG